MNGPVLVLNQNVQQEEGNKAQQGNINAAKAIADIVRTTLGPRSMLKMLLDPMGGIVLTNDGHAILREIDIKHPAAKSMIELSRAQDEEVGDGTTSVIVLAGEMMSVAEPLLSKPLHPTIITTAFYAALQSATTALDAIARPIDPNDVNEMSQVVQGCIGTKFISRFPSLLHLAVDAVRIVAMDVQGQMEVDVKRYAKIEKIPGGDLEESRVLRGVMLNKDITHAKMRRHIRNPRVLLLDCPLEYKKGESQTNLELTSEADWQSILKAEEDYVQRICEEIIALKPDVVCTEKGVSDLAQHFLQKANITALRRLRKTDNNRIARATGARIQSRTDELSESDLGLGCGLFEVTKIGDEYFSFFVDCAAPKACSIVLRGANKDVLNEIERNLHDAMAVAKNVYLSPRLLPGGGATEMAVSCHLRAEAQRMEGSAKLPVLAVADALEVIPRTLIQNCGASVIRTLTALRAKHAAGGNSNWGVDGNTGELRDMSTLGVWEPYVVKSQTLKTSIESACMLLRIDRVLSGMSKAKDQKQGGGGGGHGGHGHAEDEETAEQQHWDNN